MTSGTEGEEEEERERMWKRSAEGAGIYGRFRQLDRLFGPDVDLGRTSFVPIFKAKLAP